jgi:DUF971 family protein
LRLGNHGRALNIRLDSGESISLDAEYLRVESPRVPVKGHGPGQKQLVWGKRNVSITRLEAVGSYAVKIVFSDGHDTGLFTWPYLLKLGRRAHDMASLSRQAGRCRMAWLDLLPRSSFGRFSTFPPLHKGRFQCSAD